jgi:hypothetical protein
MENDIICTKYLASAIVEVKAKKFVKRKPSIETRLAKCRGIYTA